MTTLRVCLHCRTLTPAARWSRGPALSWCPYCEARGDGIAVGRLDEEILVVPSGDLPALDYARAALADSPTTQAHPLGRAAVPALDRILAQRRR